MNCKTFQEIKLGAKIPDTPDVVCLCSNTTGDRFDIGNNGVVFPPRSSAIISADYCSGSPEMIAAIASGAIKVHGDVPKAASAPSKKYAKSVPAEQVVEVASTEAKNWVQSNETDEQNSSPKTTN